MKWAPRTAGSNIARYYLYSFLANLDLSRGIFVLFLITRGLSMSQVGVLQTILFWSNLGAEIPAGILADKTKRKYSVAFGLLCIALAAVLMIFSRSYLLFAVAFFLHGVGFAFQSGADSAILFDGLKQAGPPWSDACVKISARARGLGSVSMGIAMCLGGYLLQDRVETLYWIFAGAMLLAVVAVLSMDEPAGRSHLADDAAAVPGVIESLRGFFSRKSGRAVFWFILGMGFIEASSAPLFIYGQVLFKDYGMAGGWIAAIMAAAMGVNCLGFLLAERLGRYSVPTLVMNLSLATSLLTFGYLAHPSLAVAIPLFICIDLLPGVLFVHTDNYINDRVPTEIRASVLSVHSFLSSICVSFAFLGMGVALEHVPSHLALGSLGILPLIGMAALSAYFKTQAVEIEASPC